VEFCVSDTGVGVPAEELPRMFERFHRVRGTRARTFEGTGIGLALVEELVKLHGGEIKVQSEEGRGTSFSVLLRRGSAHLPEERVGAVRTLASTGIGAMPFVEEALRWPPDDISHTTGREAVQVVPPAPENRIDQSPAASGVRRATILLADDNTDMRDYVRRLLNTRFEVIAVADGEAGLAAAREHKPDLVLADIMMPQLDGFGLLKALREDPVTGDIPVMLLSARAGEASRVEGLQAGADDYLIKPFSARELLARVTARLENAHAKREAVEREREMRKAAEEAEGMVRLHELSTRLVAQSELQAVLEEVLDAAITLLNADFGTVQLSDSETRALKIVAQRGFHQEFLDYFNSMHEGTACCGTAFERRERVIVEDVLADPMFLPCLTIVNAAGYRAVQSTPLLSHGGELLGIISTHFRRPHRPSQRELRLLDLYVRQAAEIIERKRAEQALRASEERFRSYFELGLIGMAVTSPTKGILEVNEELCRILGYERSELLEKTWPEFTHPEDLGADVAQFNRVMAGEIDGYTLDKRWIRKDSRVIESIMAAKCLRRADGSVNYFVGLVQDITERKHAEETLRNARAELAHMSRVLMIGEIAASIAHEVNQPLAAIVTGAGACLHWLRGQVPDLKEAENAAHRVMENALRAGDVIKGVRELVKRRPANQQPIHVNEIIRHVITLIDGELKKNEIALTMELEPDLPLVTVNRVQLEQVLLNLMINSKDAMTAEDWPARELLIRSQLNSAYELTVAVQDSGPGLRGRDSEHIFDPFVTTKEGGLGLGLSISRTIVEAHGGKLWASRSTEGAGACFQFSLPIIHGDAA